MIFEIKNFLPFSVLGEFSKLQKIVFPKTYSFKMCYRSQFSLFFEDKTIPHIRIERLPMIFAPNRVFQFFSRKLCIFGVFGVLPPPGQKSPQLFLYVCAKSLFLSINPAPVKKKLRIATCKTF